MMYEELISQLAEKYMVEELLINIPIEVVLQACDKMKKLDNIVGRQKGEWINPRPDSEMCSACGVRFSISSLFAVGGNEEPNFCPNCGADMREES